jgi:hypothetical protein
VGHISRDSADEPLAKSPSPQVEMGILQEAYSLRIALRRKPVGWTKTSLARNASTSQGGKTGEKETEPASADPVLNVWDIEGYAALAFLAAWPAPLVLAGPSLPFSWRHL